jgi:hypothetical protein
MISKYKNIIAAVVIIIIAIVGYIAVQSSQKTAMPLDPTPQNVTLSGTYTCLPHLDTTGPQTEECAFGLKTDEGDYYAVNFGASASAMDQFQSGAHITAEGFVVIKEALNSNQWEKYNMKGIFTVTRVIDQTTTQSRLNINAICEDSLAYTSFTDGDSAAAYVKDCKEGKHPEVIQHYMEQMNLGDGATI